MSFMPQGSYARRLLGRDRNEIARFLLLAESHERRSKRPGCGRRGHEGELRRSGLVVLRSLVLAFRGRHGRAWPSVLTLALASNTSRSAVHEALNRLERAGYISRQACSERSRAFDRRGRSIPIRRPSLISFHWPDDTRESRIPTGPTITKNIKGAATARPTKGRAVEAMQAWLNRRDRCRDQARAAEIARREAETMAILLLERTQNS